MVIKKLIISIEEYLDKIRPCLGGTINYLKQSDA